VGNKNDDPNSKVVETTDAQKFAEQMGINLFETSAKENINVEEVTRGFCLTPWFLGHERLGSMLGRTRWSEGCLTADWAVAYCPGHS